MGIAAAIGAAAVATVGSAAISSSASSKASKTAQATADSNNALQASIYNSNKETLSPYVSTGNTASSSINALLGLGGDSTSANAAYQAYKDSTGYQSALTQGQNSVTAALGQKGLTDSGAALKALTQYGQDYASQNFQTYLGDLQTQQSTGLSAASALAGVSTNYANSVSSNNNTAATASENATLSSANAINSALGNLTGAVGLATSYGKTS